MPTSAPAPSFRPSCARSLKTKHKKALSPLSLKAFVGSLSKPEDKLQALDWFHNKRLNLAKPPLGIGRTNGKPKNKKGG